MSWLGANPSQLFFVSAQKGYRRVRPNYEAAVPYSRRHLEKINYAARRAGSRICATENHAPNSCMHQRACAHRAWLLGHVEIAVNQSPIANSCLSLRQRQHFRMRRSVLEQLHLIMGAANNFSCK